MTKDLALNLLAQVRLWLTESMKRRLSATEVRQLAETVMELSQCLGEDDDPFAARQLEVIKAGLQQEFHNTRRGSNDLRHDVILHTHALSGHLAGE